MLRILISVLEQSVEKNGADTKLTIGRLLNICKMVVTIKKNETRRLADQQSRSNQEFFEAATRYGSGS